MKKEIQDLITIISSGNYDQELIHGSYDDLLEKFILNYDVKLLPLMKKLVKLEKNFWYA